jgi:hypothetical protein
VDTAAAQPMSISFDPAQPSNAYLSTLQQGVLATTTGRAPWTPTNFPETAAYGVSVAHRGSRLSLWATVNCNGKLYHSTNGTSWTQLTGNGLPADLCATAPATPPDIRSDPADGATLYVAFNGHGLARSSDDGQTWTMIALPTGASTVDETPTKVAISANGIAFVGTANGNVFQVSQGIATLLPPVPGGAAVTALAVDPDGSAVVVGHPDGTTAFARAPTFTFTAGGPLGNAVRGLAFAVDGTTADGIVTGSVYAVAGQTVSRSVDFGATFTDVTAAAGGSLPGFVLEAIAAHPENGTQVFVVGPGVFSRTYASP